MMHILLGNEIDKAHEFVGLNSLLFVAVVSICLFLGYNLKKYHVYYLPGSGAAMLFGLLIGGLVTLAGKAESEYVKFNPDVFFFILLPPIIFEAGFTLKRRNFFKNMTTILMFAVLGTVVSTLIIAFGLYGLAKLSLVKFNSTSPLEALLFGSLISAVDPVATLSILGSREINADPMLYSLVFGESVLNDAVAIVLFKTFEGFADSSSSETLANANVWDFIATFLGVSIGSIAIGVVMALCCSFILKHAKLSDSPPNEFTLIILFAYGTYCIAEISTMSGIVSLFFCGLVMAHYALYNVTVETQAASHTAFKSFSMLSETFVFAYLGIYAGISLRGLDQGWSALTILFALLLCFISRAANIFTFSFIANLRRRRKIPFKMQLAMWFAGLRGAIAFALALNVPRVLSQPGTESYVISTTLTIVFFTTLVCGGLTAHVLSVLGLRNQAHNDQDSPSVGGGISNQPLVGEHADRNNRGFHRTWRNFDDKYVKKWFGGSTADQQHARTSIIDVDGDEFRVNLPSNTLTSNEQHERQEDYDNSLVHSNGSSNSPIVSSSTTISSHEPRESVNMDGI